MTEWAVIGIIITLFTFLVAVVTPVIKLNTSITKLSVSVENLNKYIDKNDACHNQFTDRLSDHETRLTVLEAGRKGVE